MPRKAAKPKLHIHLSPFNIVILVLSVYVVIALLIDLMVDLPHEISRVLHIIDHIICAVFFIDFCIHFYKAENKWQYMKWGWLDLLSSIPASDVLRTGRLVSILRLLRVIRAFRSMNELFDHIFENRIRGTFTSVVVLSALSIIFSSILILEVETAPNSNIRSAEDALWWSYVTITSVGYGDKFPVTTAGRVIAAVLMTAGVALFGTFTAYVASWFIEEKEDEREEKEREGNKKE